MNDRHIAMLFLAVLIMGLAISTFGQSGPAWYSEHAGGPDWYRDHALRHDWYKDLKTKSGWSCCSGDEERGDCRPAQARQRDDGLWEAFYAGNWHIIPSDAILRDGLNKVPLHAHICERGGFVYCFLRGGGGT
jgi:hypothetical protein